MQPIEAFVRPIPESTYAHPKEAIFMGVEPAPRSLIAEIVVNDAARELLPQKLKFLTSPDYLRKNTLMSVPASDASRHLITPVTFGRCVPVAFGVIPFGDKLGRVITGKGSWVSGDLVQDNVCRLSTIEHPGLLSVAGARYDTETSNTLLAHGFRSALHLGYVVFDEPALQSWISKKWKAHDKIYNSISRSFTELTGLGSPAYLFRVGGSTERHGGWVRISEKNVDDRKRIELRQASRLLLMESQTPNFQLFRIMTRLEDWVQQDVTGAITALTHLASGVNISESEFNAYMHIVFGIYAENAIALHRINPTNMINTRTLGSAKDMDFGLYTYDYDTTEPDDRSIGQTVKQRVKLYINNVFCELIPYMISITDTCTTGGFTHLTAEHDFNTYMQSYLNAAGIPQ